MSFLFKSETEVKTPRAIIVYKWMLQAAGTVVQEDIE
jgi:hypothetical protein